MRDQRPPRLAVRLTSRALMRARSRHRAGRAHSRSGLAVTCGGPRSRQDVDADTRAINDRLIAGDYREAERLAADARDRVSRSDGAESLELARLEDLLVTALVKGGRGGTAQALALAEHARQVKEAALGRDHIETARPCIPRPGSTVSRRVQRRPRPAYARARNPAHVTGRRGTLADSLDLVALSLIRLKRFDEAGKDPCRGVRSAKRTSVEAPLALAQTLELIALMHRMSGRFADAGQPVERSWR